MKTGEPSMCIKKGTRMADPEPYSRACTVAKAANPCPERIVFDESPGAMVHLVFTLRY